MILLAEASPASVLAFATTLHLGGAALRNHRSSGTRPLSSLALVSCVLALAPWYFPSLWGLVLGFGAHASWFVACELFAAATVESAAAVSTSQTSAPPPRVVARVPAPASDSLQPPPSVSGGFVQAPVLSIFDETADIRTIRLLRPEGLAFAAGQFIPIRMRVDGKDHVRCYSISSSPSSAGFLEISVKRQGLVSNALHATARPGSVLSIRGPNGAFTYPAGDDRPIVLVAGGVGITPLMSILRYAVHTEPWRPVALVYGARDIASLAFRDELAVLARRHPQLRVVCALTHEAQPATTYYPGQIDAPLLRRALPDLTHSVAYICGPPAMIQGLKTLLLELGVPPAQIRHELFDAAAAAASAAETRVGTDHFAGARAPVRSATSATREGHRMRCLPGDQTVLVKTGQTLLEAAEAGGVPMRSCCRAGVCGTCRVRVLEGDVHCETATLDVSELDQGYVLACVATARTDCAVQL